MPRASARKLVVPLVVFGVLATSCSGAGNEQQPAGDSLVAAVASYDVLADRPGRFIVGVYSADQSRVLAYGTVSVTFSHLGTGEEDAGASAPAIGPVDAIFLPIPGQDLDLDTAGPTLMGGSEATGVYGAYDVEFSQAGFWEVAVTAEVDGRVQETTGAFEVLTDSAIPAVSPERNGLHRSDRRPGAFQIGGLSRSSWGSSSTTTASKFHPEWTNIAGPSRCARRVTHANANPRRKIGGRTTAAEASGR
jgi:hypothetical protein